MSIPPSTSQAPAIAEAHAEFLKLYLMVQRHARIVFRGRGEVDREEAVAEAVAAAFDSYLRLKARGKDPVHAFPTLIATYAVLRVQDGWHLGSRSSSKDVLSRKAQHKHGFQVLSLPGRQDLGALAEQLEHDWRTPVADQAAFRIDFPQFLRSLSHRDRRLAYFLGVGNSAKEAAAKFKLSPGRITQLRQQWCREWLVQQGGATDKPQHEGRQSLLI
jgi:hypothetical protein